MRAQGTATNKYGKKWQLDEEVVRLSEDADEIRKYENKGGYTSDNVKLIEIEIKKQALSNPHIDLDTK